MRAALEAIAAPGRGHWSAMKRRSLERSHGHLNDGSASVKRHSGFARDSSTSLQVRTPTISMVGTPRDGPFPGNSKDFVAELRHLLTRSRGIAAHQLNGQNIVDRRPHSTRPDALHKPARRSSCHRFDRLSD